MKLTKQPETEVEYWEAIEVFGGYIWSTNHALCHGRIEDSSGKVAKSIEEAVAISERLIVELGEKFGVMHPRDCPKVEPGQQLPPPPDGKVYYWDWYKRMKESCYRRDYESIICSACPFSEGSERMISLGGVIPCGVFRGTMYKLSIPYQCGMLMPDNWNQERLYAEIAKKGGLTALAQFQSKEQELKAKFEQKPQS